MRLVVSAFGALAVAWPACAAPAPGAESIEMTVNSWGQLINGWTLRADGSAEVRIGKQGPGGFTDVRIEVRQLAPDAGRYPRVRAALRPAEAWAGREIPCPSRTTDLPYGDVHWRAGASDRVVRFDSGCEGRAARAALDALQAADRMVVDAASAH